MLHWAPTTTFSFSPNSNSWCGFNESAKTQISIQVKPTRSLGFFKRSEPLFFSQSYLIGALTFLKPSIFDWLMHMLQYSFYTLQWHLWYQSKFRLYLSPTLIRFYKFVSLNQCRTKCMNLHSIQYIHIPASNITTQLLVFCCDTALEPVSNYLPSMHWLLLCSHYSRAWWKPMLELPTAHYFLSGKVGAAHCII